MLAAAKRNGLRALVALVALVAGSRPCRSAGPPTLRVLVLRARGPVAGIEVLLRREGAAEPLAVETDDDGLARFAMLAPGSYRLRVAAVERTIDLTSDVELASIDLALPSLAAERFGRFTASRASRSLLPYVGTVSGFLETIEPLAITQRIDVAGVEGATEPLWSVRGSSFTQNRILLDGLDVTDPAGGTSLLYPDAFFFEEIALATAATGATAAGPGTELRLVTPGAVSVETAEIGGSASVRWTGSALQSTNIDPELASLGVEPRAIVSYPSGRVEAGAKRLYGALDRFSLATRMPRFDAEDRASLLGATAKLSLGPWSALGMVQRFGRPTLGARPDVAPEATVNATETSQVAQASYLSSRFFATLGMARGHLEPRGPPPPPGVGALVDLATGRVQDAPPRIEDRARERFSALASGEWDHGNHLVRAGVQLSHARETTSLRIPTGSVRLEVDGEAHAVSISPETARTSVGIDELALYLEDDVLVGLKGRRWRLTPGARLDWSRSSSIRWATASGSLAAQVELSPRSVLHFSAGLYPHALTTRLGDAASGDSSWTWYRWSDLDSDRKVSPGEVGSPLRRGGPGVTTLDAHLPRPRTCELTVGVERRFGSGFIRVSGYQRWETNLPQTLNVGISPGSYESFLFHDVGIDGALGTPDDRDLRIYDQRAQLGEDRFVLTHPDGLSSMSQGVDLLVGVDHRRISWRLSGRAYRDVGRGNEGNGPNENDTGVLGDLFDDPNTLTNAEGRLYFDRAFTGKLSLTARAPADVRLGAAVRYWDGQPFSRQLFFPDLGQGFTVVQAFPRGRLRYGFNMTVDVRLERDVPLGPIRLTAALEAYNLFNQTREVEEDARSGMRFRDPTRVQPARTIVLEAKIRF
jgi:hypothetical protein